MASVGSAKDRRFRTCASVYLLGHVGYFDGYSRGVVQAEYQTRPDGRWHLDKTHGVSIYAKTIWDTRSTYESGAFDGKGESVFRSPTRRCRDDVTVQVRGIYGPTTNLNFQDFGLHAYC